ncbi:protein SON [Nilaparvata lugens]|uniref:protein SON n=1 Tax=Nilaparvata lugens TaxID=108931 RepID=UPI00193D42C1|nr:protein SON [Nilaparvata lugens]
MQSPVKSSNEILSELFGAFNAKPPEISEPDPIEASLDKSSSDNDSKIGDKDKKKKSKHHKSKKSKKHSHRSSDSDHKKKKRKKKDEKHKRKSKHHKKKSKTKENLKSSPSSSDSEESDSKLKTLIDISKIKKEKVSKDLKPVLLNELASETPAIQPVDLSDIEPPKGEPLKPIVQSIKKEEDNSGASLVPAISDSVEKGKLDSIESEKDTTDTTSKVEDVFTEIEKPKPALGGKIMIKNLKFSSVFEETVKQVEEQARLKAEKYEEGEISDSSSNAISESKSSSPVPSIELETVEKTIIVVKSSHSKHSPSRKEHRKRSRSPDKHKHKSSGIHSSSHKSSHRDKKSSSHRSRSGSRSRLKTKDPYSSKDKDPYSSKEKDTKKCAKRRRSSERSSGDHRHHHHHHHSSRGHSRKESDHHDSHRSSHKDGGKHGRKRSASPARKKPHRSRSPSRSKATSPRRKERRSSQEKIDKQKLLEIARRNALSMLKQAPPVVGATEPAKATIAAGGKTVDELTDFCKLLSKKDADGHESISSNTSDSEASESEKPFHHPFQIKDRPSSIVLNIRNAVPMPLKTLQEKTAEQSKVLSQQFPVSSGQLHRKKESDWVPVPPKKDTEDIPLPALPPALPQPVPPPDKTASPLLPPLPPLQPPPMPPESIFPVTKEVTAPTPQRIDVSTIMTQRLAAMKQLERNPSDVHAKNQMNKAELHMQAWAESKYEPGQFTGSTGARILTPYELAPGSQAWTRPDQLVTATPVKSGMGMTLLQKMGWRPGEGLGKNKEGALEPLLLKVKMDKKGLVADEENEHTRMKRMNQVQQRANPKSLEGKHPVSLLNEFCTKRRYGVPTFNLCFEGGPDHKKTFLFKVTVNGVEYKPSVSSLNKKQARVEAAVVCLKAMGVLEP